MRGALRFILGFVAAAATGLCAAGELRHALWDASQKAAYQQCARDFEKLNPDLHIRVQQQGWDDYWGALSTGFVAGTAPDVFTNQLAKLAEQVENGVLLDLAPLIERDHLSTDIYEDKLLGNWSHGKSQYALPADWDTVALVVNLEMTRRAGIPDDELQDMDWNPRDGGSFGRVIARLTLDHAGRNAMDPQFDARHVQVFGYQTPGAGGLYGQTEWSHFAVSNGFRFQDAPWQRRLLYDDPRLHETLDWLVSLNRRGVSATPEAMGKLGSESMFTTARVAMIPAGSWMVGFFSRNTRFAHAFVPLPRGPLGFRASMFNGLAHSIWKGSKHQADAWRWVKYLGSDACQAVVARYGVVYPAVRGLSVVAAQVQIRNGANPKAFFDMAQSHTFAPPIADHVAQITDIINGAAERAFLGQATAADAMTNANAKANAVLAR